jgi:PIN domain nuclease of toxin-antitoxin system
VRLLLDTHGLLWCLNDDDRLGSHMRSLIANPENDVLVNVVSLWEITVKLRIGKLDANIDEILEVLRIRDLIGSILPTHI